MRACDVIKPEIIERLLNQLLLKQRTQKPFMENTKKGSKLADSESDTEEKNNNKNLEVMNSTAD